MWHLIRPDEASATAAEYLWPYWLAKGASGADALALLTVARAGDTRGFGLAAAVLAYVPVFNWALSLTNVVGAALLAADLEVRDGGSLQLARRLRSA